MQTLKKIYLFFMAFFNGIQETEEPTQESIDERPVRRKRKKREKLTWNSFKHLRKYLDAVYGEVSKTDYIDATGYSHNTSKHTIKMLRSLGPYMMAYPDTGSVALSKSDDGAFMNSDSRPPPAVAFIGFPDKRENSDKTLFPRFMFAAMLNKCEHINHVELTRRSELIYEVGAALYDDKPPRWLRKAQGKLAWVSWYAALDTKTGKTRILRHWAEDWTGKHYRKVLKGPTGSDRDSLFKDDVLSDILNLWLTRDMHWQVAAEREGHIITFCIDDNHAKDYFKDRYVVDGGRRKPIFHWVKSHYRDLGDKTVTVKTHTRGKQLFRWGDYDMAIRQPGKDAYMMSEYDIEPVNESALSKKDKKKFISGKKAMKMLHEHELMPSRMK